MQKLKTACVFIIIMLMLPGCGKVSYEDDIAAMTQEMKLNDFNYIIETMDALYPFWGELADDGIDKDALEKEYKDKIAKCQDTVEYLNIVGEYFKELSNKYGHLAYLSPPAYMMFKDAYKGNEPWDSVLLNSRAKAMYEAMDASAGYFKLASGNDTENVKEAAPKKAEDELSMEIINDGNVIYISCPSFGSERVNSEPDKIVDFIEKNSNCENLIIDIRGNGGGSDLYWYNAFAIPNITQDASYSMYYLYTKDTLHNKASQKYIKRRKYLSKKYTIDGLPPFENLSPYAKNFDYFYPSSIKIKAERSQALYQGNIYVLMDGGIASASANFTEFCKENKFAVLVGEATGGDQCLGDPSLFMLPNSGLIFRFDLFYGLNADGTCNGVSGVKPDIECSSADALNVCLDEINRK